MVLTVYTRIDCSLCAQMLYELEKFKSNGNYDFLIKIIDIDADDKLRLRYNELVPVLFINDKEVCRYYFDENKLNELHKN
jgi:glutaredoxin